MKSSKRHRISGGTAFAMLGIIWLAGCASWDASRRLQLVTTPQQEAAEFNRIAACPEMYRIKFLDKDGQPLADWDKDFNKIGTIIIKWPNGITARHHIVDPANIRLLIAP